MGTRGSGRGRRVAFLPRLCFFWYSDLKTEDQKEAALEYHAHELKPKPPLEANLFVEEVGHIPTKWEKVHHTNQEGDACRIDQGLFHAILWWLEKEGMYMSMALQIPIPYQAKMRHEVTGHAVQHKWENAIMACILECENPRCKITQTSTRTLACILFDRQRSWVG